MNDQTPTAGARIFNHGDMANVPHHGTITQVHEDEWGGWVEITTDAQPSDFGPEFSVDSYTYRISPRQIGHVYNGNGLTRIVTEEAYNAWREAQLTKLAASRPMSLYEAGQAAMLRERMEAK